ncbi:DsbA family protein [Rhodococcus wratislaviensis]|uniref:DsbA family protein n=1 Tax=Rhodococcus wratislaviensis TaxID=44752 RepID=UPI00365186DD
MNRKNPTSRGSKNPVQAQRRHDLLVRGALTAVVVVFAVVVGAVLIARHHTSDTPQATPASVTDTGAIRAVSPSVATAPGTNSPKAVLTVYEDFQCPVCKNFEAGFGDTIDQLRTSGAVAVDYHPISILDRMSSTQYSTRAANASLCVADTGIDNWLAFHRSVYQQQPPEGGSGLTDQQMIDLATAAGAPESVAACITDGRYTEWVASSTQSVLDTGVSATPTVLLNGEPVSLSTPAALAAAVAAIG